MLKIADLALNLVTTSTLDKDLDTMQSKMTKFAGIAGGIFASIISVKTINDGIEAWTTQAEAENKLNSVMKQRMGANDEMVQSIKDLASAQQNLGVVGDEVQLAGLGQLATFLNQKESLEALSGAMNDMIVNTDGYNASTATATSLANQLGKAMANNSLSALVRSGITVSDEEQKTFEAIDNEVEKAQYLAQIITQNVGKQNEALAKTPLGKIQQVKNAWGDVKEEVGEIATELISCFADDGELTTFLSDIQGKLKSTAKWISENKEQVKAIAKAVGAGIVVIGGLSIVAGIVSNVMTLVSAISAVGTALGGLSIAAGPAALAIAAVAGAGYLLFKNWDTIKEKSKETFDFVKEQVKGFDDNYNNIFSRMGEKAGTIFEGIKNSAIEKLGTITGTISGLITGTTSLSDVVENTLTNGYERYRQFMSGEMDLTTQGLDFGIQYILNSSQGVVGQLSNIYSLAITTFKNMSEEDIETLKKFANDTFKASINSLFAALEFQVNTLIEIVNGVLGFTTKTLKIKDVKLPTLEIPRLYTGAYVPGTGRNGGMLAQVGDVARNTGEYVLPEQMLRGLLAETALSTAQALKGAIGTNNSNQMINCNIDGTPFIQLMIRANQKRMRQTGRGLF